MCKALRRFLCVRLLLCAAQEFPEFCQLMLHNMSQTEDEETLCEAFKILDADGSGSIERGELFAIMKNFSKATEEIDESEIDALIREADVDGDGQIGYEEFAKVMMKDDGG